jgi:hypothetical protein
LFLFQTKATIKPDAKARNIIVFNTVEANPSALIPFPPDLEAVVAAAVVDVSAGFPAAVAEV